MAQVWGRSIYKAVNRPNFVTVVISSITSLLPLFNKNTCSLTLKCLAFLRSTTSWQRWWWEGWSWRPTWTRSSHRWTPKTRWRSLRYVRHVRLLCVWLDSSSTLRGVVYSTQACVYAAPCMLLSGDLVDAPYLWLSTVCALFFGLSSHCRTAPCTGSQHILSKPSVYKHRVTVITFFIREK